MKPHWERGYRCHGYWIGIRRIGVVGIGQGRGSAKKYGYKWRMDFWYHNQRDKCCRTLREAKRAVEKAYEQIQKESDND